MTLVLGQMLFNNPSQWGWRCVASLQKDVLTTVVTLVAVFVIVCHSGEGRHIVQSCSDDRSFLYGGSELTTSVEFHFQLKLGLQETVQQMTIDWPNCSIFFFFFLIPPNTDEGEGNRINAS